MLTQLLPASSDSQEVQQAFQVLHSGPMRVGLQGLNLFKGGVLMVSHDQHLIEATVDELWAVEGGRASPFHGTFEDYKKKFHPKK